MRLLLEMGMGKKCEALSIRKLTDLHVQRIQADEIGQHEFEVEAPAEVRSNSLGIDELLI